MDYLNVPICYGVKSGLVEAFVLDVDQGKKLRAASPQAARLVRPYLIGRSIKRYGPVLHQLDLIYTPRGVDMKGGEAILHHLRPYREQLPRIESAREPLAERVDQKLNLNAQAAHAKTEHQRQVLQRNAVAVDRQIDQLVYQLYGLTDEEIRIVEDATS